MTVDAPHRLFPIRVDPEVAPGAFRLADLGMLREQLADEARSEAPLDRVFTEAFLAHHAGAGDLWALLSKAGVAPSGDVDRGALAAIGRDALDRVAKEHTDFLSWEEFEAAAERAYVARRLLDQVL